MLRTTVEEWSRESIGDELNLGYFFLLSLCWRYFLWERAFDRCSFMNGDNAHGCF